MLDAYCTCVWSPSMVSFLDLLDSSAKPLDPCSKVAKSLNSPQKTRIYIDLDLLHLNLKEEMHKEGELQEKKLDIQGN